MSAAPTDGLALPTSCAVSLTFANQGENGPGMQKIGGEASQPVTMQMLRAAQFQWTVAPRIAHTDAVERGASVCARLEEANTGQADLIDLSEKVANVPEIVGHKGSAKDSGVLVLRRFVQRQLGDDALDRIEDELESQDRAGLVDRKALFRGRVKNKKARGNNVLADFTQEPDYERGKGTVLAMSAYPRIAALAARAQMWLQQDGVLICEQNRYDDAKKQGIGWHGDAERTVVFGARFGQATSRMPLMFQAFYKAEPVGPKTTIHLERGDVYIMSSKAVGTDWKSSSMVTWRHAAGDPIACSYVKEKKRKRER